MIINIRLIITVIYIRLFPMVPKKPPETRMRKGKANFGYVLYIKPEEYERAASALNI